MYRSYPINYAIEFLSTYKLKHFFIKYQLLKFVLISLIIGFFISVILLGKELNLFNVSSTYYDYVLRYWGNNIVLLLIVLIFFTILFSNAFRAQFKVGIQFNYKPELIDTHTEKIFNLINKIFLSLTLVIALLFGLPVIQLTNTEFITIITPIIATFISIGIRYLFKKKDFDVKKEKLNHLNYQKVSYNSASIGNISQNVFQEIEAFNEIYNPNPFNDEVIKYLSGDLSENYKGHRALIDEVLRVLNDDNNHNSNLRNSIVIRERTSNAIQIILKTIKEHTSRIYGIYTDGEYPDVQESIKQELGKYKVLKVDEDQIKGVFNEENLYSSLVSEIKQNENKYELIIVIVSHVFYRTGVVLNLENMFNKINSSLKKVIFIIDGAQAVGNIVVSKSTLDSAHFYAFCGHKWLMSLPHIGFAINNKSKIEESGLVFDNFMQTDRSFSTYDYEKSHKGTIDPLPYISLSMALRDLNYYPISVIEEHNSNLSKYFKECIKTNVNSIHPINTISKGGLVTIRTTHASGLNKYLLHNYENSAGFLIDPNLGMIRFTFHYNMDYSHVNRLIYGMMEYDFQKQRKAI